MGWILPAAMLGGSLLGGIFGNKSKQKQAEAEKARLQAEKEAQERKYAAEQGFWNANEAQRGSRMDAVRALLGNGSSKLPGVSYNIPQSIFDSLRAPRPFAGSLPADPTAGDPGAGLGYNLLGGLAGGLGGFAQQALLGQLGNQGSNSSWYSQFVPWENAEDRNRICALAPSLPGCPKTSMVPPQAPSGALASGSEEY